MANSKIYLGNTNIGSLFKGASDISIYLGENKVYPLETPLKFQATYSGGETYELDCDGNTTLTLSETHPSGYQPSAMTEAIIGDCVTEIGGSNFSSCKSLTSVTIPNSVTTIGNGSFSSCVSLTSIDIPSGVTSIGNNAFNSCSGITSIVIPSGVTSIEDWTFTLCYSLTSVTIPSGVTSIGVNAFNYCRSLTSVTIPSGVTSIGTSAFRGSTGLTSVTVNAVTPPTLGDYAFDSTQGEHSGCPIYVPSASLTAYQTAWSDYASRIQAIP